MNFKEESNRISLNDENGRTVAEITFPNIDSDTVNINHTYVDESMRGGSIASSLMEAACAKIKSENKKVFPSCSYAEAWFKRHPEYSDLLK